MPNGYMSVKREYAHCDFAGQPRREHDPGMNMANIRKRLGLTQTDLAEMIGVQQPTVSRAERADGGTTLSVYIACAAALRVPLAELFIDQRAAMEDAILDAFRALPADRREEWVRAVRAAASGSAQSAEETGRTAPETAREPQQ